MNRVIVVGGGAAGMMAAIAAARGGASVILLEQNEKLGKKIYITGKGRCNVTNSGDAESFFANCVENGKFLYSAYYGFDSAGVMDFFEREGCALKVERGERVFPVSDRASDVTAALAAALRKSKVEVRLNSCVQEIVTKEPDGNEADRKQTGRVSGVRLKDGKVLSADSVILATGGLSYPTTGSTGDGLAWAASMGHTVTECVPSLVPFETRETWCKDVMGLALKNVNVRLMSSSKLLFEGFGEMLFTHFGVSGPLILSASSYYAQALRKGKLTEVLLYIDLKPALSEEQLDARLLREFEENKNKQFKNALGGLFPVKLIPIMIALSGIDPDKKVHEITRQERKAFGQLMKNLPLHITGTRNYYEAIITKGGVSVKEVNPSTMESKKVAGLYLAGEMLDVDSLTGGFNLQIAWSTGHLAGESAAQGKEEQDEL